MNSPTQLTLNYLRKRGWLVGIVEKFVPFPKPGHRVDLFGFCDLLAIHGDRVAFIQACAGASHAVRLAKVKSNENLTTILGGSNYNREVWVMSWRKCGERGKRKTWTPRIERIWPSLQSQEIQL